MKRIIHFSLALALMLSLTVTAAAQESESNIKITTVDSLLSEYAAAENTATLKPYDIEYMDLGGTPVIIKKYELDADTAPNFPETAKQSGRTYHLVEVLQKPQASLVDVKTVNEPVTIQTDKNERAAILAALIPSMEYSQGEYSGVLTLDPNSIQTDVSGTSSYSYATNTQREYTGLDRADTAYIPKTIQNTYGQTLTLADVNWQSLGGSQRGDMMIPSAYTALATYTGTATGTKATGYTTTANYTGEVRKESPGNVLYSAIYEAETVLIEHDSDYDKIIIIGLSALLIGVIMFLVYTIISKRNLGKIRGRYNA